MIGKKKEARIRDRKWVEEISKVLCKTMKLKLFKGKQISKEKAKGYRKNELDYERGTHGIPRVQSPMGAMVSLPVAPSRYTSLRAISMSRVT